MTSVQVKRTLAFLIDISIISLVISIVENFLPITIKMQKFEILGIAANVTYSLALIFYFLYFFTFASFRLGSTIGKSLMNIYVVTESGETPLSKQLVIRSIYKVVSIVILPVSVALFLFKNSFSIQEKYTQTRTVERNADIK